MARVAAAPAGGCAAALLLSEVVGGAPPRCGWTRAGRPARARLPADPVLRQAAPTGARPAGKAVARRARRRPARRRGAPGRPGASSGSRPRSRAGARAGCCSPTRARRPATSTATLTVPGAGPVCWCGARWPAAGRRQRVRMGVRAATWRRRDVNVVGQSCRARGAGRGDGGRPPGLGARRPRHQRQRQRGGGAARGRGRRSAARAGAPVRLGFWGVEELGHATARERTWRRCRGSSGA